ncbi:MAG: hypothetical protein DLM69_03865 [Candidatus Chloroheliales bacterium]|nr:MAG: hypothetical protein DLM69_03865 [Chloroflexota bacterium]
MKVQRLTSFALIAIALLLVLGQGMSGAAKAAPHYQVSTTVSVARNQTAKIENPASQVPYRITVQGRLTDPGGNPISNATSVTFKLYQQPTGGSAFISEGTVITPDANGLFTYQVGTGVTISGTVSYFGSPVYLGISVGNDSEMTPRFLMTAAPYAMGLADGANIVGPRGIYIDNNGSASLTASGIQAQGPLGVYAQGLYGAGVLGISDDSSSYWQSTGVIGLSNLNGGVGGAFTGTVGVVGYGNSANGHLSGYHDGVSGLASDASGSGVYGHAYGANGEGVWGSAQGSVNGAIGGWFDSYDLGAPHTAIYARGSGHASGGWVTPNGFAMMVKYNGTDELHPGDVLALDGNNADMDGVTILGTVKAKPGDATVGVAQYRYSVYSVSPAAKANGKGDTIQADAAATSFQTGDLIEVVIAGQARMKAPAATRIGDRLGLTANGVVTTVKDEADTIARVAGVPDHNGYVTVFVNFK